MKSSFFLSLGFVALFGSALVLIACGGSSQSNTPPPGGTPNQLGQVLNVQNVTCPASVVNPPVAGSACYDLTVRCNGVPDYSHVELKETDPAGSSLGTIIYTSGGGGNQLYEDQFVFGNTAVNNVVSAGFTAVQTNFNTGTGWLDGPGGPLKLSCRWATTAQWIHDNIRTAGQAFCATGNSGGAGAIAYALSRFGQASIFNYVEPTSGPPFSRIDFGCGCSQTLEASKCAGVLDTCYGTDANMFIDPSYGNAKCSNNSNNAADVAIWQADSILSSDQKSVLSYSTRVHFLYGGQDMGSGVAEAVLWENAIQSSNNFACVASAPHKIADDPVGAATIAADLIAGCR